MIYSAQAWEVYTGTVLTSASGTVLIYVLDSITTCIMLQPFIKRTHRHKSALALTRTCTKL